MILYTAREARLIAGFRPAAAGAPLAFTIGVSSFAIKRHFTVLEFPSANGLARRLPITCALNCVSRLRCSFFHKKNHKKLV